MRTRILIIYTGGTIGMMKDHSTGTLMPMNFMKIITHLPELNQLPCDIDSYSFKEPIDSADMNPEKWINIAEIIEKNYDDYDGFIILHGSDTMAYTASVLSFLFENLAKPVILTGSQLPIGEIRTDGRENIISAVEIATGNKNGKPIIQEVCIYFEHKLFRGNRSHKFDAEQFRAFRSINYPLLANTGVYISYNNSSIGNFNKGEFKVHKKLDDNIAILKLFPGIKQEVVQSVFNIKGLKAVVMETYGTGNAPTAKWFVDTLKEATDKGIIILNITQCKGGAVELGKYITSLAMANKNNIVSGNDITTESAVTKLMYLFGNYSNDIDKIKKLLTKSLRGEMTEYND